MSSRAQHIPPLKALLAFEAAATHDRLIDAADSLGVTESAVSHQIRGLEARLDLALFDRSGGRLTLTEAGAAYLTRIAPALRAIAEATAALAPADRRAVRLTLPPSLAVVWVIPRLAGFEAAHPKIEVQLIPTTRVVDLARDRIDLSLRHGTGPWAGVTAERLFDDRATPVAAPGYADGAAPLSPKLRYLANRGVPGEWAEWARARGLAPPPGDAMVELDSIEQALELAEAGYGVAIGRAPHLDLDARLAEGRLVAPFGDSAGGETGYHLCRPAGVEPTTAVKRVAAWLRAEAAVIGAT